MDQDDVVDVGAEGCESVGDGLLAVVAAFDYADAISKSVFGGVLGYLRFDALHFGLAHSHVNGGYPLHRGEGAQGVDEDGKPVEGEKLLGLRAGHAGAQSGGGKNHENLHNG